MSPTVVALALICSFVLQSTQGASGITEGGGTVPDQSIPQTLQHKCTSQLSIDPISGILPFEPDHGREKSFFPRKKPQINNKNKMNL